jgi:hypothetical protein
MRIETAIGVNVVSFDTETGYFYWVKCNKKPKYIGKRADRPMTNGYQYIKSNQKQHSASRLAYKLAYKVDPGELEIDHINRIRNDNRPENLRLVTREQQLRNRAFKKNKCGVTGVSLHKQTGLYRARYKSKTTYHKTLKEAEIGYNKLFNESS